MKKAFLLLIVVVLTSVCFAQKIKVNEVDKFTKKHMIETSFEKIVSDGNIMGSTGGRLMKNIWVAFEAIDSTTYLRIKWCTNSVLALSEDAKVMLLDKDGNTYTFKNTSFSVSGNGEGTVGMFGSALPGLNLYLYGDASKLEGKEINAIRFYTTDGYMDFDIKKQDIISELYTLLKEEKAK